MEESHQKQENNLPQGLTSDRLDSWKEIAAFLDRDVRTVIRWEKWEGLPVRRHVHQKQATVYASRSEIDTWLENRGTGLDKDEPAHGFRFFSENKKTVVGVAGGVTLLLLLGVAAWMDIGFSPNPEGLNFQQRDWVLIADFDNRTGEAVFDGVLESALRREIANSQFVNVIPRERIEDTLRLMRKPLDTRIDPEVAREVSLRDGGIKALLTGRVEKLDSTYLLSIELIDPTTGQGIAATSEEVAGQSRVLSVVRSLSNWGREALGEKLALVQKNNEQLERVTTPSFPALQLFTKAEALIGQGRSGQGPAETLLKQAVDIDPEFASAHIYLAWAVRNQRKPADEFLPYAEKAFQLAGTTGDRERYFIEGSYYQMKGEHDSAIHAYETLLSLYPDHFWAPGNLISIFRRIGEDELALTYQLRRADLRPNNFMYTSEAAHQLLLNGDLARAKTYWGRALDVMTPEDVERNTRIAIQVMWFPAFEALLHADPETALGEANRSLERLRSLEGGRVDDSPMGALYLTLGKIGRAREWFEESTEPGPRRQVYLAAIAYVEEDHKAMTEHMEQALKARDSLRRMRWPVVGEPNTRPRVENFLSGNGPERLGPTFTLLLAPVGLLSEWELNRGTDPGRPDLPDQRRRTRRESIEKRRDILRGMLTVSQDNRIEELKILGDALSSISLTNSLSAATYFMGSEILAEGWRKQGDAINAAEVLRTALEKEAFLLLGQSVLTGPLWLKLRAQLSKLYREMGRHEDARKLEEELRRRLALADRDHPILRQLDRTQDLAIREPTDN